MTSLTTKLLRLSIFTAVLFLALTACKKKKEDPAPIYVDANTNNSARFFRANIASTPINYTENHTSTFSDAGANGLTEDDDTWMTYNAAITNPNSGAKNSISMQIGHILITDGATVAPESQFNAFFSSGAKNYTTTTDEKTYDGLLLVWIDGDGEYWTTLGDQTGSNFTINKVTRTAATSDKLGSVMIEATFNCMLYNGGNSKTVTNGKLKLMFRNMYKLN